MWNRANSGYGSCSVPHFPECHTTRTRARNVSSTMDSKRLAYLEVFRQSAHTWDLNGQLFSLREDAGQDHSG